MSYCDDCIILDICGKEGCCDEAMTFCADKNKFIYVSILDKIRAEIEQTVSRYSISRERGCMGQVEWSDRLIKESEVLQIIDKYRESEEICG